MTDVLLCQTTNNGDITLDAGTVEMSPGLETAAYLSLFGGSDWWGNIDEDIPARQYTSKTQALLETLNPSSRNLLRIEEAAKADLAWFISDKVANTIEVVASIPALNKLNLLVTIRAEGQEADFTYVENWKASA